jgi:DNA ligase-1
MMASYKLDGMRCIFKNGEMLSRQFKPIINKQLNERFEPLKKMSLERGEIYDGELYSHELNFQEIMHYCRTDDLGDEPLPESINFYCFDWLYGTDPEAYPNMTASMRYESIEEMSGMNIPHFIGLEQRIVSTPEQVKQMFEEAIAAGFEGLILKTPESKYKFGRISIASGTAYKFKPYQTFDSKIIGVEQATEVDPTVERKVGELGYHKTSRKKGDRIPIEKASAFRVLYDGKEVKVSLAMTDEEKEKVWREKDSYTGKYIEYKAMLVGSKDLPRHPVFTRFREDKDD